MWVNAVGWSQPTPLPPGEAEGRGRMSADPRTEQNAQVSETSEGGVGAGLMDLGIKLVQQKGPRYPKCHSCLQPFMFGTTVPVPSLSPCESTRKSQSGQRHTGVPPNHMRMDLMPQNFLFPSTLLQSCPFSEDHLEAASSISAVLLVESLCAHTT